MIFIIYTISDGNTREGPAQWYLRFQEGERPDLEDHHAALIRRRVRAETMPMRVPRTPEFMRGVINLRGSVVPVVDLRLKCGMTKTEKTVNTCIIIVEVKVDRVTPVPGALADSVQKVLDLEPDHIEPAPKIGTRLDTEFIKGMGKRDSDFIIILDIDRVLSARERAQTQAVRQEAA